MQFSVAPMMDYTDKHDRYFLRLIAPDILLYTEMITTHALIHGDKDYLLDYHPFEHPLALQLGGSDPVHLAQCAKMGEDAGYDEINLNVGCPSPRVSSGRFGACLMHEPHLVAECVSTMQNAVKIPVTVKTRIGVDDRDSYEHFHSFIETVSRAGCHHFIIHARKAWLKGLSPKQNRDVPPLKYDVVERIKKDFPVLKFILNGGIKTLIDIQENAANVDGFMIGRAAYSNPYFLADIQQKYFPKTTVLSRHEIVEQLYPYIEEQLSKGVRLSAISRHILGLFQGQRGANAWRRYISENTHRPSAGLKVIQEALAFVL